MKAGLFWWSWEQIERISAGNCSGKEVPTSRRKAEAVVGGGGGACLPSETVPARRSAPARAPDLAVGEISAGAASASRPPPSPAVVSRRSRQRSLSSACRREIHPAAEFRR